MQNKEPIYNHFSFVWLTLTAAYLIVPLLLYTVVYPIVGFSTVVGTLPGAIGLFVPFGFFNLMASLSSFGIVTFGLLVASLFVADPLATKLNILSPVPRLLYNLIWLLLLTACVDLILWGWWASASILLHCPSTNDLAPALPAHCGSGIF